ncbi:hypothetical protein WL40_25780 [Burkholderia ubonensis]|nr:hypothetical protein WJ72_19615 [Burkholderia ubonensis]KVO18178.1 hypothetical protein WJ74_06910 [Burkholderia ubonensis]KVO41475.1 hypothetical protein WJ75_05920 [Burkholderia ubonensis]KVP80439.1 hypothetical protein WJ92_18955 [Burkholderia ubonensis]KVQ64538.1 hypothetical protein WK05_22775 [Burkholderia ubonensis]
MAGLELTRHFAPEELPFFDDFIDEARARRANKQDPLAFGVHEVLNVFTPHILDALQQAGTVLWGTSCTIAIDVSKDIIKERIKVWLSRRANPRNAAQQDLHLLPFAEAIGVAEQQLQASGVDAVYSRELAISVVASLLIASASMRAADHEA